MKKIMILSFMMIAILLFSPIAFGYTTFTSRNTNPQYGNTYGTDHSGLSGRYSSHTFRNGYNSGRDTSGLGRSYSTRAHNGAYGRGYGQGIGHSYSSRTVNAGYGKAYGKSHALSGYTYVDIGYVIWPNVRSSRGYSSYYGSRFDGRWHCQYC